MASVVCVGGDKPKLLLHKRDHFRHSCLISVSHRVLQHPGHPETGAQRASDPAWRGLDTGPHR